MENMQKGWKKEEFSSPDLIWMLDLSGQVVEKNRVVKVSGHAPKLVYLYLVRCLDIDQRVMPSRKTIARFTQLSESTVKRALKILVNFGLIEIIHRFKEGTKENDTNYYIVYHPKQVQGLKYLKISQDQDAVMPPGESTVNPGGGFTMNPGESTVNPGGGFTMNPGESTVNRKISSSSFYSSSVVESPLETEFQKINQAWQECFQQEIDKPAFITLIKHADIDFLIDIINKIKKHHMKTIDSPFAFVFSCIQKGGYIIDQSVEPKQTKRPKQSKPKKKMLSVFEDQSVHPQPESDERSKEEIKKKIRLMDEEFKKRKQNIL